MLFSEKKMMIPKGLGLTPVPLVLNMEEITYAESRLPDIRVTTPDNAAELLGVFNTAASTVTKYMAWVQYELLMARQSYDKRKAIVILDEMPTKAEELKSKGVKMNEDVREALLAQDSECFTFRDRMDCLEAVLNYLDGKRQSFVRGYSAVKSVAETKRFTASFPQTSTGSLMSESNSVIVVPNAPLEKRAHATEFDLSFGEE